MSHYETLCVPRDATPDQIETAWRSARKRLHPDKHPELQGGARESMTAAFQRAKDAYECLIDPVRRHAYDTDGEDRREFDSIDAPARHLLSQLSLKALDSDEPLLHTMRNGLKNIVTQQTAGLVTNQRSINRVQARKGQITYKGDGVGLVFEVLDQRLASLEAERAGLQNGKNAAERALKMLDAYEEQGRISDDRNDFLIQRPRFQSDLLGDLFGLRGATSFGSGL